MNLEAFARTVLFGTTLEEKLAPLPLISPQNFDAVGGAITGAGLIDVPSFPGRPARLARLGKADFPKLEQLAKSETARGQVLHFFANHELLAMELMALMLLRFPSAPEPFRTGIARTIAEEQSHMRLYIERMQELGVSFGDLPLSDYFWNAIKDMRSPLEFVTQMSLTLEQANLDYSLYYQKAIERAGDAKTAAILERVYREEIGHVKHGVQWFNRFRADAGADASGGESDWDAYLRLLPPPMTPRRAKGLGFTTEGRREAGLSERFISELEIYGGSKGRPPVFWLYNPTCDAEIARGKPGYSPPSSVQRLSLDLEPLLMNLAADQDVVLVRELPRAEWLREMRELGFSVPEFRQMGRAGETPREPKVGGLQPWGWSPEPWDRFRGWREKLVGGSGRNAEWASEVLAKPSFLETGIGPLFSKQWSAEFLREWLVAHPEDQRFFGPLEQLARIATDWPTARDIFREHLRENADETPQPSSPGRDSESATQLLAKAPWGTSGAQNKRVRSHSELDGPIGQWIQGVIESQGAILIEPWLNKIADLSLQIEVEDPRRCQLRGVRRFYVGAQLEYRGTELDARLSSLDREAQKFLHAGALERWKDLARALGERLARAGYRGPAGLDAMLWRDSSGALKLKPLVELNPRWTMGRVALAVEERVAPGVPARWIWVFRRDLTAATNKTVTESSGATSAGSKMTEASKKTANPGSAVAAPFAAWVAELSARHPARQVVAGGGLRISEGVVATTDPARAREALPVLAVGDAAIAAVEHAIGIARAMAL